MKLTKSYRYTTDVETLEFTVQVKVSVKFQFYVACSEIPESIIGAEIVPARKYASSFGEIDDWITDLIEKYEATFIQETRVKVIAYYFNSDEASGRSDGGHGLSIAFRVLWEFSSGNEKKYLEERRSRNNMDVSFDPVYDPFPLEYEGRHIKVQQMEWTAEREAWFAGVCKQIEALSKQIRKGIGVTPTVLARKIDQHVNLLLPGGSDE